MLERNSLRFANFQIKFDTCTFEITSADAVSDAFYKTCVMLDAIYNIRLQNPRILAIESMKAKLATHLLD